MASSNATSKHGYLVRAICLSHQKNSSHQRGTTGDCFECFLNITHINGYVSQINDRMPRDGSTDGNFPGFSMTCITFMKLLELTRT